MSYAITWSENGGPLYAGRLELADRCVRLAGTAWEARESRGNLFFDELADVQMERNPKLRLSGRPTLVLERRNGSRVRVASLQGAGALHELADRVTAACARAAA